MFRWSGYCSHRLVVINRFVTASQHVSLVGLRVPRIYCFADVLRVVCFVGLAIPTYRRTISPVVDFSILRQLTAVGVAMWGGSQWRCASAAL